MKNDPSTLARTFFDEQCQNHKKQDWIHQVLEDLNEFKIVFSFEEIEKMSKYKFKKIVKKASYRAALEYLMSEKQKLSNGKHLNYSSLQTQNYLKSGTEHTRQDTYSVQTRNLF